MKSFGLPLLVLFGLINNLLAEGLGHFFISTNQALEVKQKLDSYEKGHITLKAIAYDAGEEANRQLIGYYLLYSNNIQLKATLPIAVAFGQFKMFSNAIAIGKQYVNIYPKNLSGERFMAAVYFYSGQTNESLAVYRKLVHLGDNEAYEPFAGIAIQAERWEIVREILPKLLTIKDAKETPKETRLNLVSLLLFYSLKANQKDVFIQALKGVSLKEILSNESVKMDVIAGCNNLNGLGKDIEKICKELEAVAPNDSSTNAVSTLRK